MDLLLLLVVVLLVLLQLLSDRRGRAPPITRGLIEYLKLSPQVGLYHRDQYSEGDPGQVRSGQHTVYLHLACMQLSCCSCRAGPGPNLRSVLGDGRSLLGDIGPLLRTGPL